MPLKTYGRIVDQLCADPAVRETEMMGMPSISLDGQSFCGIWEGELVVRVGRERVDLLVLEERGLRFDPSGRGRQLSGWAVVPQPTDDWPALAAEAYDATRADGA